MPDTPRSTTELLNLFRDGQAIGTISEQDMRDFIKTFDIVRRRDINVQDTPFLATGDGLAGTDDTVAITTAHAVAKAIGATLFFPSFNANGIKANYKSSFTLNPAGFKISGYGATYTYTGAGTACQWEDDGNVEGLVFVGNAGVATIGGAIGKVGVTAHRAKAQDVKFTNFNDGWIQQLSFYGRFTSVECVANIARNYRVTNTGISNDYIACISRGTQITLRGVQLDDTTTNSSGTRWWGGTIEGAVIQNVDIVGADNSVFFGTHIEQNAPTALVGTVSFTNGNVNVVGVGTAFTTAIKVGQYIKADAHAATTWMRVNSITDDLNLVLTEAYQGATLGGTAASIVGGNVRVTAGSGATTNAYLIAIEYSIGSGTCPAVYVQNGSNVVIHAGDLNLPVLFGASSIHANVYAAGNSGGNDDRGQATKFLADADNSRFWIKNALNKVFSLVAGGAQTQINTGGNPVASDSEIRSGVGFNFGANRVLSSRRTGYTNLMTGTANRATAYDTTTITLQQLAERVKAMEDDLHSTAGHGAIGP